MAPHVHYIIGLSKTPNLDITEPDRITMILQTDITFFRDTFGKTREVLEFTVSYQIIPFFAP